MKKGLLLLLFFILTTGAPQAQEAVHFGQYTVVPEQNVTLRTRGEAVKSLAALAPVNGSVNVLIQFKSTPSGIELRQLQRLGVALDGYLGGNAYFAQLPYEGLPTQALARMGVTSVMGLRPEWKVTSLLTAGQVPEWAKRGADRVAVTLSWFANVDADFVRRYAQAHGYSVGYVSGYFSSVTLEVPQADVMSLAAEPWVRRVAPVSPPEESFNRDGATLSGGNLLSLSHERGGRALRGRGVRIGLWDGNVERHVDFGDRLHVLEYCYSVAESDSHGIHTAGTIAGAGLLNPRGQGVAPLAELYAMNFATHPGDRSELEEMLSVRKQHNIALTSNSYGRSLKLLCQFYDKLSYTFMCNDADRDRLACAEPTLTHIYAVGNDRKLCDGREYGSSASRAKNVIYVGAVDKHGRMSDFSSWGPTDDGRLLPTLCAKGVGTFSTVHSNGYALMDGTSMACPTVAGHVALLVERYHQLHGGLHPNSALVKGLLANTADDKGNKGPDYQYGYGILNAPAALSALESNWYAMGRVQRGEAGEPLRINVPRGVRQLRVMLTWLDPAPAVKEFAYGEKALVNDLDLSVSLGGVLHLPYVLNPKTPEAAATRGIDDCNNIEQVVIENPSAGIAEVTIGGQSKIREGDAQEYVVTWYFDYGAPSLLCPVGGEMYSPGDEMLVRADNLEGITTVEISYDGGEHYHFVASTRASVDFYSISVPVPSGAPNTHRAKLRLTDAKGHVLVTPQTFTVARQPKELVFSASGCDAASWNLSWNPVAGVQEYVVLRANVASGEWKKVGETRESSYSLPLEEAMRRGRKVYAVAIKLDGEAYGPRSQGVLADGIVPKAVKADELPFLETFVTLPLEYASVEVRNGLSVEYVDAPEDLGLPLGARMLVATTLRSSSAEPFAEPDNMLTLRLCKMDLRGVAEGTPLLFSANLLMDSKGSPDMTQLRLRINGEDVTLAQGKTALRAAEATAAVCWDVSRFAGQKDVTLELQYASHTVFSRLYLLGYALQEGSPLPDVGVYVSDDAVKEGPHLGKVNMPVTVFNSSLQEEASVSLVVRLDGAIKGSTVVKSLQPYEQRRVYVPVDFSTQSQRGHVFSVEVQVDAQGDVNPDDNVHRFEVNSMGDVLPHPTAEIFEIPGLLRRSVDPQQEVAVGGRLTYTDMGGLLKGYAPEQDASVRFYPSDPTKVVMVRFKMWDLDEHDKVEVYASALEKAFDYADADAACELEGKSSGESRVVVSTAADGSVYVHFVSSARSRGSRGWEAEVTMVERVNALTLLPMISRSFCEEQEVPLAIEVRNNAGIDIEGATAVVSMNAGEYVSNVDLQNPFPAGHTTRVLLGEQQFPIPSLTDIEVTLVSQQDFDESDNVQQMYIRNDYLWGGGTISDPCVGIEYIYASSQTVSFEEEKQYGARLDYNTEDVELPFYTQTKNPLFVKLTRAVPEEMLPGWVYVWVEDGDRKLTNGAPDYYARVPLERGKEEYEFSVDLTGFAEGSYRMRVAIFKEGDLEKFQAGAVVQYGRATDVVAEVTDGENEESQDVGIELTPIASGAGLPKEQAVEVTITNLGYTEVRDVKVSLTADGGKPVEEVVAGPIAPFGVSPLRYTFSQTVDLSRVGEHKIEVSLVEADGNGSNNAARMMLYSLPEPAADALYALEFQGKQAPDEAIDFSRVPSVRALNATDAITLEGWFYLREKQNAVLFETPTLLVGTAKNRREVPDNSLVVIVGTDQRCYSKLPVLTPGQYHHIVVSLTNVPGTYGSMTKVTTFVDGVPVEMVQRGEDVTNFGDLRAATNLDGRVKMVRFWNRRLGEQEIKENMRRSVRGVEGSLAEGCVAEFMMNEGQLQYLVSGKELAGIESARVDAASDNIWQRADRLIAGIHFEGQQMPAERKASGEWEVTMPYNVDASRIKGDILTLWEGTEVTYKGVAVNADTEYDFAEGGGKITLTACNTLFGVPVEERDVVVTMVRSASHECDLLRLELTENANLKAPQEVRVTSETVVLPVEDKSPTERVDLSRCVLTLADFSDGATVVYVDGNGTKHRYTAKGDKVTVDLSRPAVLTLVSANGRGIKSYTIAAQRTQTVQWEDGPLSTIFTAGKVPLDAKSSSGNAVRYLAADEHVVTVDAQGFLHTVGVGETILYASVPNGGGYAESNVVKRRVSVTPAPLTIRPAAIEIEEGSAMPAVVLEFEGLLFGEQQAMFTSPQYAVFKDASTPWTPDMPPLPEGDYAVKPIEYTEPYRDGNYLVTLQEGRLRVKRAVNNKRIEFTVADSRSAMPIEGADVTIDGVHLRTDAVGKAGIYMPKGRYEYSVSFSGYALMRGAVEVDLENVAQRVALNVLGALITYESGGKGSIAGERQQRPAYGVYGSEVAAVPQAGCDFVGWSDGQEQALRRDKGQAEAVVYTALFKQRMHTLSYSVGEGGEWVSGERQQQVLAGEQGEAVRVKAAAGWFFAGWSDGVTSPERRDAAEGDLAVEALFYEAFRLPLVESFDAECAMPRGWATENFSHSSGSAVWRVGAKSSYQVGAQLKAFMDANAAPREARNDAALLTPWVSLQGVKGDLELSFDWYYKADKGEEVALQYRLDDGAWRDAELQLTEEPEGARKVCKIAKEKLQGENVQFRWRYAAGWGYGVAVDNVVVQQKGAERVEYVAGEHGTLQRSAAGLTGERRIVLTGSELGEAVTAIADAGYRFVAWSDGLREATRSDQTTGRFEARFGKLLQSLVYDGGEGTIEGLAYQQVEQGGDGAEVCAVAPLGKAFVRWSDGLEVNPRRDVHVEEDVKVRAEYGNAKSVVYGTKGEGTLEVEAKGNSFDGGTIAVAEGTKVHFVAHPAEGNMVKAWEGVVPLTPDAQAVTVTVDRDINVMVTFAKERFTLTYAADAGEGRVEGRERQEVDYGEDGEEILAVPAEGYHFKRWSDGVATALRVDRAVKQALDVRAEFGREARLELRVMYQGTAVEGAHVSVGGYGEKVSDGAGRVEFNVAEGDCNYAVVKEGVGHSAGVVKVGAAGALCTVELGAPTAAMLRFVVRSGEQAVQGAIVTIGSESKMTGAQGEVQFEGQPFQTYAYTVSKSGYVTVRGEKVLEPGGSVVEVMLEKDVTGVDGELLGLVTLRPNPVRTELIVGRAESVKRLRVVTLQGAVLLQRSFAGGDSEVRVALGDLASGVYVLEVEGAGMRRAIPFVVVR